MHRDSTVRFTADVVDETGRVLRGHAVALLLFDTTVARLGDSGRVTGLEVGPTELVAASESVSVRIPVAVVVGLTSVAPGSRRSCAVSDGADVYCWGGVGQGFPRLEAGLPPIQTIASGLNTHCAVSLAKAAYCWGPSMRPGNGSDSAVATPVLVSGGLSFTSVGVGWYHACGLALATVYCWGGNGYGSTAGADPISVPRAVPLSNPARNVTVGAGHTCAVLSDDATYCWGHNRYGQVGAVDEHVCPVACSVTPFKVDSLPPLVSVTAGVWHTCGLTADGTAYCWGSNPAGELGFPGGSGCEYSREYDSTFACSELPRPVHGGLRFTALVLGEYSTCGLVADGSLFCWGSNYIAQYGNGERSDGGPTPVRAAGGMRFRVVSASDLARCGITLDTGTAYCWGSDFFNNLGNGPAINENSATPVRILYQP